MTMPREIVRFLLIALLLLFLAAIFSIQASAPYFTAPGASSTLRLPFEFGVPLIFTIGVCAPLWSAEFGLLLTGAAIVVVPALGQGALGLFVCGVFLSLELRRIKLAASGNRIRLRDVEEGIIVVSLIGLLVFLLGAALTVLISLDGLLLSSIYRAGGLAAVCNYVIGENQPWWKALTGLCGWITGVIFLFELFAAQHSGQQKDEEQRGQAAEAVFGPLLRGISIGAVGASIAAAAEISGLFPGPGPGAFVPRPVPATFSSPAAFGATAALIVPLLLCVVRGRGRMAAVLPALLLAAAAGWSGSRAFVLGLAIFGLWFLSGVIVIGRTGPRLRYLTFFGAIIVAGIILGFPPLNYSLRGLPGAPPVLVRALEPLNWDDGSLVFLRRSEQTRILYQVWRSHPLVGVGIGRLGEAAMPEYSAAAIGAHGLRPNNYYLLILAECGLIGLLLFVTAVVLFSRMLRGEPAIPRIAVAGMQIEKGQKESGRGVAISSAAERLFYSRGALVTVLVMLFSGPYLQFDEYRLLVMAIIALAGVSSSSLEARGLYQARGILLAIALFFPVVYFAGIIASTRLHVERGLYRAQNDSGRIIAWTGDNARIGICRVDGPMAINLRSGDPLASEQPVTVRIDLSGSSSGGPYSERLIQDGEWHEILLDNSVLQDRQLPIVVSISVNRLWRSEQNGRWLGLAVEWASGLCPWAH